MWIKICGMTTPEAVEAALAARVDAIGFVFSRSARQLTSVQAQRLSKPARGRVPLIAVTQHPSQQLLDEILEQFRPDIWQSDVEDLETLRAPGGLPRLPVLRAGGVVAEPLPARVLFEGPRSGTGLACDWTSARRVALRTELVLAGGLDASNVASAIESVKPFGVDVSSGVEARAGLKSPEKIIEFTQAARTAFRAQQEDAR